MGALQGLVICRPVVNAKIAGVSALPVKTSITKEGLQRSGLWGSNPRCRVIVKTGVPQSFDHDRTGRFICCSSSSSSDGNDNLSWSFNEKDEEYVNSSVIEAVEVRSGSDGFMIKMRDGRHLRCVHNTPQEGQLPDYAPHPAIVLKMDDGSDILLPIIVLEMPTIMLMAAVRNIQIARPTIYNIVKEMVDKMGYEVRLVRVTKRVHEAYFAQLYLTKVDNGKECITLDLRPSDAINIAVRCKVPIQVNKHLAQCDGMRVVKPTKSATLASLPSEGLLFTKLDRPDGHPCLETKEFILVRNMLIAAVEERYGDAGIQTTLHRPYAKGEVGLHQCSTHQHMNRLWSVTHPTNRLSRSSLPSTTAHFRLSNLGTWPFTAENPGHSSHCARIADRPYISTAPPLPAAILQPRPQLATSPRQSAPIQNPMHPRPSALSYSDNSACTGPCFY